MKNSIISDDVIIGENVKIYNFVNLYGCKVGGGSKIGTFVEIQKDSSIGKNCKISSHSFICSGVTIGDSCFVGHGVMFINDNYPRSTNDDGLLENESDWEKRFLTTNIGNNVAIGSNATILGGIDIGEYATIGAGSVVTNNVDSHTIVAGNPAKPIRLKNR